MGKSSIRERAKKRYDDRGKTNTRIQAMEFGKKDISFWKAKKGRNHISILPYIIATKKHPMVRTGDAEVGDDDFVLEVWVHRFIGEAKADIICPKKMWGKPCPICEQREIYLDRGKEKEAGKCKPQKRAFYNIVDEDDRDKGVQIFQESYVNFQDEMMNDAGDTDDGELVDFWDFKKGRSIKFRAEEAFFNKNKFFEYRSFKFSKREPLPESFKKDIIDLDKCMVIKTYDEIKALYYGEDVDVSDVNDEEEDEDEVEDEKPQTTKKSSKKVEDEDEEDEDEDEDEDDDEVDEDDEEDDEDDEPEEEEKPKAKAKIGKKAEPVKEAKGDKKSTKHPVDDDDDDIFEGEDSTLETAKKVASKAKPKGDCPFGHEFGKDCDKFDDCEECDKYTACYKAKKASKGK